MIPEGPGALFLPILWRVVRSSAPVTGARILSGYSRRGATNRRGLHSVVNQGDGGLGFCGDSSLHGVVVIAVGALERVGAVKDEADETAHSVF